MARQRGSKREQRYPCGGKVRKAAGGSTRKYKKGGKVCRGMGAATRGGGYTRAG